jgi:hypothetical protein
VGLIDGENRSDRIEAEPVYPKWWQRREELLLRDTLPLSVESWLQELGP